MSHEARLKEVVFYGVFVVLFILYGLIVLGMTFGAAELSGRIMQLIASMTPIILKDLSLPGELTPAILGGVIAITAPSRASLVQMIVILVLALGVWLAYLHMQVFFTEPAARTALQVAGMSGQQLTDAVAALSSFSVNVRSFAAVVFAAVLGLRFNSNVPVVEPKQEPKHDPVIEPDPDPELEPGPGGGP